MLFPRLHWRLPFRYSLIEQIRLDDDSDQSNQVGSMQVEAACSIGATSRKLLFGISHILTAKTALGYNLQLSDGLKRRKHSLLLRHDLTDDYTARISVSREESFAKSMNAPTAGHNLGWKISHTPPVGERDSSSVWQFLKPTKREFAINLNTGFVRLKLKQSKKISQMVEARFECIADTVTEINPPN